MSDDFDLESGNWEPVMEPDFEPAPPRPAPYLDGLNTEQRQAVETMDGPLLILAGAGTGKTRVLTTRLAHLLYTRKAFPSQILAVTFTNKAAREMRERVGMLVGDAVEGMWLGTFHSLANRILRMNAELVGLRSDFTILDTDDQLRLIKSLLQDMQIDDKRYPPRMAASVIDRWKDKGLTPEKVSAADAGDFANGRGLELYRIYEERLKAMNAVDFSNLLLHNLEIFTKQPDILTRYQQKFRYILVDEYQDTNVAQYLWLRLLAQKHHNICCVGDDDQSIYGWRGAEVGNILRFEKDYPEAKVVRLERNYRSTENILGAASKLIANNTGRLGKTLWTEDNLGEKVLVRSNGDAEDEASYVAEEIENFQRKGHNLNQMAVLVRASFQTRSFEERFLTNAIPYKVVGGLRFYERAEIRDTLAYLRVLLQPDDDMAFERIHNNPPRGIGKTSYDKLSRYARSVGLSITRAAMELTQTDEIKGRARTGLLKLLDDFGRWRTMLEHMDHGELVETLLEESGYLEKWRKEKSADAPGRVENLKELVRAIEEFDTLPDFMEHVSLVMDNEAGAQEDQISIMTLHAAKGLEFDTVFLPGWEEEIFPHQRALDENGNEGLEEERRLAYVGITRARKKAIITYALRRRIYDRWQNCIPSRFIDELPDEHVERQEDAGYSYGGYGTSYGSDNTWESNWGTANNFTFSGGDRFKQRLKGKKASPGFQSSKAEAKNIQEGERVFHQKFGYGTVLDADGSRLIVDFDTSGEKKVVEAFVDRA